MTDHVHENKWNLWGQDLLVDELRRSFPEAIRHAYVLSGPEMSGKTTLAVAFAKALLCTDPPTAGDFCGVCRACRTTSRGLHQDMATFDLAWQAETTNPDRKGQSLSIDTVRQISRSVSMRPVEAPWRVVIVDDVETMQEPAQEAFLKTLEEPPPYTVILLLTTDANILLPTILSRTVQLHMSSVSTEVVRDALISAGVKSDIAAETALVSQGLIGWAMRAIADPDLRQKRLAETSEALAWVSGNGYSRMITAVKHADRFSSDREAMFNQLHLAMLGWRALLLCQLDVADRYPLFRPESSVFSQKVPPSHCAVAIESIRQCMFDLESNVRPRLALQSMVSKWPVLAS